MNDYKRWDVDIALRRKYPVKIKVVVWQEGDAWCGSIPALPGCHTWGESREQLLVVMEEAVQGWLEVAKEEGTKKHVDLEKHLDD